MEIVKNATSEDVKNVACNTCRWMNELVTGAHCSKCTHAYISKYEPIKNRDFIRLMSAEQLANIIMIDKPYCDPIMGDMVCGTAQGCAECFESWLNGYYQGREKEESDASLSCPTTRE